jgi:hypothetical protein
MNLYRDVGNKFPNAIDPSGQALLTVGKEAAEKVAYEFEKHGLFVAPMKLPPFDKNNPQVETPPSDLYIIMPPSRLQLLDVPDYRWKEIRDDKVLHALWHRIDAPWGDKGTVSTLIRDPNNLKGEDVELPKMLSWNQKLAIFVERAARDPHHPQDIKFNFAAGDIAFAPWELEIISKLNIKDVKRDGGLAMALGAPVVVESSVSQAALKKLTSRSVTTGMGFAFGFARMTQLTEAADLASKVGKQLVEARVKQIKEEADEAGKKFMERSVTTPGRKLPRENVFEKRGDKYLNRCKNCRLC